MALFKAVVWALIFLTKLRFPPGVSIAIVLKKQLLNLVYGFLHWKCIIKQLLDSVFVICKIINVSVRVIILAFGSANNSYLDIDNFHITINLIQ